MTTNREPEVLPSWPPLPWNEWEAAAETLQMWTQVVGKVKLRLTPFLNEFWEVAFHLTGRGMTTGIIPYGDRVFDVTFDFVDHNLYVRASDGAIKTLPLLARPVADFYREFMAALRAMGIEVAINTTPTEVPHPIPFEQDQTHAAYDPAAVRRWWQVQLQTAKVLQRHRARFVGKSSPIQFFWGSFDLNHTRYSGRPATPPPGPIFFRLAEDQENVACGFWPGNPGLRPTTLHEAAYYCYIYPEPPGFREAKVQPSAAYYAADLGEFVLRYEDVRTAPDPDQALLAYFQSTYEAAATLAHWDRQALEKDPPAI